MHELNLMEFTVTLVVALVSIFFMGIKHIARVRGEIKDWARDMFVEERKVGEIQSDIREIKVRLEYIVEAISRKDA